MKQIIVADDDFGIRDIFRIILERAGYAVTTYSNGEILMTDDIEVPDIFIIDKQLSGVDGIEVCRYLKRSERTSDVPVIIVSASPFVAGFATEAGADSFLEKPFKTAQLLTLVETILNKKTSSTPI